MNAASSSLPLPARPAPLRLTGRASHCRAPRVGPLWAAARRTLLRGLCSLLLLLLIGNMVALPLRASLQSLSAPQAAAKGWHIGMDRLHIEPDERHRAAERSDHAALRPTPSIRPHASQAAGTRWTAWETPGSAPAAALALLALTALMAWFATLGALAAWPRGADTLLATHADADAARGRAADPDREGRPWRGLCPPRQAPPGPACPHH